jgi:hypothetical protein
MMVPKKSLFLAGFALLFAGMVSAQAQVDKKTTFRRYTGPLNSVDLDLESGVITRGPVVHDRAVVTCDTFLNTDLGGFVGVDSGSCACEWYDAGTKNGGKSTYVSGFRFAYCSAALDTLSGGPGGAATLFFNSGYTLGANGPGQPANGTDVARIALTGLPANTASSFFGGFQCYFITVRFAATFCLADGNIGYGWKFADLGTDGVLGKTFPFLSCVTSCTGPGPDGQGMVDMVDQYCPPGFLNQTFSFGTTPNGGYFTSVSMQIREATSNGPIANATFCATNPATLADSGGQIGFGPNIGDENNRYRMTITCPNANGQFVVVIRFGNNPAGPVCAVGPKLGKFAGALSGGVGNTPTGPPGGNPGALLPKFLPFACIPYTNQGVCLPGKTLSNAVRETIGIP